MLNPVRQRQGVTLSIRKEKAKRVFAVSVILSHDPGTGNTLRELFSGMVPFAVALRTAEHLSRENGHEGYYEIVDETEALGPQTFATMNQWKATMREVQKQMDPLKAKSGFSWGGREPVTRHKLERAPVGPHLMRLMDLHADLLKRRPVTL
jgi:hypothetical protein